jgi:hypothetical protein
MYVCILAEEGICIFCYSMTLETNLITLVLGYSRSSAALFTRERKRIKNTIQILKKKKKLIPITLLCVFLSTRVSIQQSQQRCYQKANCESCI